MTKTKKNTQVPPGPEKSAPEDLLPFDSKTSGGPCANFFCREQVFLGVFDKHKKNLYCLPCFMRDSGPEQLATWRNHWDGELPIQSRHALGKLF